MGVRGLVFDLAYSWLSPEIRWTDEAKGRADGVEREAYDLFLHLFVVRDNCVLHHLLSITDLS